MSKAIEEVLERVALEIIEQPLGFTHPITLEVLKRRLGPLLEAGQAMRDEMRKDIQEHEAAWSAVVLENNWDAALAAGQNKGQR